MSICQIEYRDAGLSYPRTCPTCKLSGKCVKGLDRKSQAAEIARLRASIDAMTAERDAAYAKGLEDAAKAADSLAKSYQDAAHMTLPIISPIIAKDRAKVAERVALTIRAMKDKT